MDSLSIGTIVKVKSTVAADVYIAGLAIENVTFMEDVPIVHVNTFGSIYLSDGIFTGIAGKSMSLL